MVSYQCLFYPKISDTQPNLPPKGPVNIAAEKEPQAAPNEAPMIKPAGPTAEPF